MDPISQIRQELNEVKRQVNEIIRLAQVTEVDVENARLTCESEGLIQAGYSVLYVQGRRRPDLLAAIYRGVRTSAITVGQHRQRRIPARHLLRYVSCQRDEYDESETDISGRG